MKQALAALAAALAVMAALALTGPAMARDGVVAGPHLSGDAYTALRGDAAQPALIFEVETGTRTSSQVRSVTIGPDYAIEVTGTTHLLYDFRFRRLVDFSREAGTFSNESLFGHARTRFSFLQNNLSTASMALAAGLPQDSDEAPPPGAVRFLHEHVNGMAHPADVAFAKMPAPAFVLTREGDEIAGTVDGLALVAGTLGETAFPSDGHARSFAAWLAWGGRMHPAAASALAGTGRLPAAVAFAFPDDLRAAVPGAGGGLEMLFRDPEKRPEPFDRLRGLEARLPAWPPYLPEKLAQTMVDAANGTAPGGPKTDEEFIAEMNGYMRLAKSLDAVLVGLHASHPYDGCAGEHRARPLCVALGGVINQARRNPHVQALFGGFSVESQREYRRAAQIWVPLRARATDRVDVLDFVIANALVEAHKKAPLQGAMATAFEQLPELFTRALAVDPYDPARYRDIYNYLFAAATGLSDRYLVSTRAHAVIDLARALPDRPMPAIVTQIVDTDRRIADDFPVLFPVFGNP